MRAVNYRRQEYGMRNLRFSPVNPLYKQKPFEFTESPIYERGNGYQFDHVVL